MPNGLNKNIQTDQRPGNHGFRRAFCVSVRVSRPQNSLLYIAIIGKQGVSLGQNHLYFALKPI